jgi:hypothetical protein
MSRNYKNKTTRYNRAAAEGIVLYWPRERLAPLNCVLRGTGLRLKRMQMVILSQQTSVPINY